MPGQVALRRAGVLLHPTSLPSEGYTGDFGPEARRFIDTMAQAGLSVWQVLPIGPTHEDGCPYQSSSVHAGNPDLINLDWLVEHELLTHAQASAGRHSPVAKRDALDIASSEFFQRLFNAHASPLVSAYAAFTEEAEFWLEGYVRFQAFRDAEQCRPWTSWPQPLRNYEADACNERARELAPELSKLRFRQFIFHQQWLGLKAYANERGIKLFGDMPIYVHLESADVWAHQRQFNLDEQGRPITVTGVPPDYFSAEGQLWGNPQYDWQHMLDSGFDWWLKRFESAARMFDMVRIDHFRALEAFWEIPASADSAQQGHWVHSPGRQLLELVRLRFPELHLVAENLGIISPEVEQLRHEFSLPGMIIMQFAFDGNPENPYLAHQHTENDIVYTGTHDNDTSLGWFLGLDEQTRQRVCDYFQCQPEDMPWAVISAVMASPANMAIVPWQDFLGLDSRHRMNTPGTTDGNWQWRFSWEQVPANLPRRIQALVSSNNRLST
jgi:4-alpha-glucanotransferase